MKQADATGRAAASGDSDATVEDYFALLKPRVMSLVVFTAAVGMIAAPGLLHPVLAAASLLSIAVGAGAAGALNMWYDSDIDREMSRTRNRPVPRGRISREDTLFFGAAFSLFSVLTLALAANYLAAALLAATIGFYLFIYTMWLKRRTPQNIVIGGAAGALPPVVGWAAVSGSVSLEPIIMFLIIFLWTPPHFWALSLYKRGDYERAGVPMMPVVRGDAETRRQIWLYSLVLVATAAAPLFLGFAGFVYGGVAAIGGAVFLVLAYRVWRKNSAAAAPAANRPERNLFGFSILYLFSIFAAIAVENGFGLA